MRERGGCRKGWYAEFRALNGVDQVLLPANPHRRCVLLAASNGTFKICVAFGQPATAASLQLPSNGLPLVLDDSGPHSLAGREIHCIGVAANSWLAMLVAED